ncbi:MAG TPA: nuclear transport factor 2 family protein [Gemmatimonadaceae bacterium]|nr:nuclear transport factor 2 family protein [Gemmatimonadaceae bacterium]
MTAPDSHLDTVLRRAYASFNARDIDAVLALMHPDVDWPNGWEGGWVKGHEEVRTYWTRQWAAIDPRVEPLRFEKPRGHETIRVVVEQTVRDREGNVLTRDEVQHLYYFEAGLVRRMEIETD